MRIVTLSNAHDFGEWRAAARALLRDGVPPQEVAWRLGDGADLFAPPRPELVERRAVGVVPRGFVALARLAIGAPDADRFDLLYRLLWRLQKDRTILARPWDVDVGKLHRRADTARRSRRRGNARARPSVTPAAVGKEDVVMAQGMAPRAREAERGPAAPQARVPADDAPIGSLAEARAAISGCTRCDLYKYATQAVFGEGPQAATIMFVGEQPGEQEDLQGKPFVGPAGRVLAAALEAAGIPRRAVYVTNAVKHFKFTPRGKKRIHKRPDRGEVVACRFWLDLERAFVRPKVVVALGATAAQSLLGRAVTISANRGEPIALEDGSTLFVTIHPSYLLRLRPGGDADVAAEQARFEADLKRIRAFASSSRTPKAPTQGP